MKKIISLLLAVMLVAGLALNFTGCGKQEAPETTAATEAAPETTEAATEAATEEATEAATEEATEAAEEAETVILTDGETYGEGAVSFTFVVTDLEGNTVTVTVNTDETTLTVGAALLNLNLIAGSDSDWGLYVDTVNGITLDYNTDGAYWAFYIDGEYASTGVDATDLVAGTTYAFTAEKA